MKSSRLLILAVSVLLTVGSACPGDIILFDDYIDAQQKTETRYDVPDGCVVTGLGFRAAYDNITTMHCRYHRLSSDGKLTDPKEVYLGSEAEHGCEAKVLLPDGWVAVGFGAAGEPEWDVTLLRIWARPLRPDGTLGEMKTFSAGKKPDRGTEREAILTEPDRVLTGVGLRFHHNDIGGIYIRSKRLLVLDHKARANLRGITRRIWVVEEIHDRNLDRIIRDITEYGVDTLCVRLPYRSVESLGSEEIRFLRRLSAEAENSYVLTAAVEDKAVEQLFQSVPKLAGIVIDLETKSRHGLNGMGLRRLYAVCQKTGRQLCLRYNAVAEGQDLGSQNLIPVMPKDMSMIVFCGALVAGCPGAVSNLAVFGDRDIFVEIDLTGAGRGRVLLPDVQIAELAGLTARAALAGAKGFAVKVNAANVYMPQTINALALQALHRLADDPMQSTDTLWNRLCAARYGAAAGRAETALKRASSANRLIFRIFDVPILWNDGRICSINVAQNRLKSHLNAASSPAAAGILGQLLEPSDKILERAKQEKETALWLIRQCLADSEAALKANPNAETRALHQAMQRLEFASQYWQHVTEVYLLTKIYAIDGAPATRSAAESALTRLRDATKQAAKKTDVLWMLNGIDAFIDSVETSLKKSQKNALLVRRLNYLQEHVGKVRDEDAVRAFVETLTSDRFAPHLSKQYQAVGRISSSLRALGGPSDKLHVLWGGDGKWSVEKIAGRWCWTTNSKGPCIYMDASDGPLNPPADYVISFQYFDKGDWSLHLDYDSDYPSDQRREYHPVEPLQLTDTNTWKTGSFVLTNCRFNNSQNLAADMRFVSGKGICVRDIRLKARSK